MCEDTRVRSGACAGPILWRVVRAQPSLRRSSTGADPLEKTKTPRGRHGTGGVLLGIKGKMGDAIVSNESGAGKTRNIQRRSEDWRWTSECASLVRGPPCARTRTSTRRAARTELPDPSASICRSSGISPGATGARPPSGAWRSSCTTPRRSDNKNKQMTRGIGSTSMLFGSCRLHGRHGSRAKYVMRVLPWRVAWWR